MSDLQLKRHGLRRICNYLNRIVTCLVTSFVTSFLLNARAPGKITAETQRRRGQRTEDRGRRPEARGRRPEARGRRPEDRGRMPEDRGRRPEDRGRRPEDRGRGPEARHGRLNRRDAVAQRKNRHGLHGFSQRKWKRPRRDTQMHGGRSHGHEAGLLTSSPTFADLRLLTPPPTVRWRSSRGWR